MASGLTKEGQSEHIDHRMMESVLTSFRLTDDETKDYDKVMDRFEEAFFCDS
jgi:hypothetical protein